MFNATVGFVSNLVRSLTGFLSRIVSLLRSLCLIAFSASIKSSTDGKHTNLSSVDIVVDLLNQRFGLFLFDSSVTFPLAN